MDYDAARDDMFRVAGGDKDHVKCSASGSKAILRLWHNHISTV